MRSGIKNSGIFDDIGLPTVFTSQLAKQSSLKMVIYLTLSDFLTSRKSDKQLAYLASKPKP